MTSKAIHQIPIYALTGCIGSGKSTVSKMFEQKGIPVVDADLLAREVVKPGSDCLEQLKLSFGDTIVTDADELDRPKLASIVFSSPAEKVRLEKIMHPAIKRLAQDSFINLRQNSDLKAPFIIYAVPLLFESNNQYPEISKKILVYAPEEICLARIMQRDNLTREQALLRIRSQMDIEQKKSLSDIVIDNSNSHHELELNFENLYNKLNVLES